MNDQIQAQAIDPAELPETITRYLNAHRAHDSGTAIGTFTNEATVVDDGNTYAGSAAIQGWLTRSSSEYTYTIELIGTHQVDHARYVVTNRLEGNFPGGQVDLRYQFTLRDGLIGNLTIEP